MTDFGLSSPGRESGPVDEGPGCNTGASKDKERGRVEAKVCSVLNKNSPQITRRQSWKNFSTARFRGSLLRCVPQRGRFGRSVTEQALTRAGSGDPDPPSDPGEGRLSDLLKRGSTRRTPVEGRTLGRLTKSPSDLPKIGTDPEPE